MEMPRRTLLSILYYFLVFTAFASLVDARIHTLRLQDDPRKIVYLTRFGFREHGYLAVKLSELTFSQKSNNAYGLTLDRSLRSESEVSSLWDDKNGGECALSNENGNKSSLVFFLFEFNNSSDLQVKIIRNGDLRNLTITLEDKANVSDSARPKRSADYKLSPMTSRQKRDAVETNTIASTSATSTSADVSLADTVSSPPPEIYASVDYIPSKVRSKGQQDRIYEMHFVVEIKNEKESGLYGLTFHNCFGKPVNVTVTMVENNNGNYLSVGQMPLPIIYFALSVVYFAVGSGWFYLLCSSKEGVFKIHYLMLALMYIKATSLLFHGVNYHFIEAKGRQEEAFAILFYIVYLMRGIFMFATIVLIGAGWTFVKHILSDRDKKIFVFIIPLQILTNVAHIIMSESEEGQSSYTMWKNLFVLVDLLCCGAILFPVVWSIRHLQQASQTDGKAAVNLEKLKIFRHFYILVVCYIYFTRIIILLMSITVPFRYEWLDEFLVEVATLAFFMLTGYKFRPASNNPYLQIPQSDDEMEMEVVTQSGALEGVTRVNVKTKNRESEEPLLKQRENSHEYD